MKRFKFRSATFTIIATLVLSLKLAANPITLSCQGVDNPIGLDETHPHFSWKIDGVGSASLQQSYQILVATTPAKLTPEAADIWNSGKTGSPNAQWIKYAGKQLTARTKYYWKVLIWTSNAQTPIPSDIATFSMGLMQKEDWKARWIGLDTFYSWDRPKDSHSQLSARYFRKTHTRKAKTIKTANLYFTGLGLYKLFINGEPVGTQELAPSMTDFTRRVFYDVFDVTKQLSNTKNTFAVILGNGRFFSMRPGEQGAWKLGIPTIRNFGYPKLIFQLEIEYTDGTKEMVISDDSWKVTADGPIRSNNEYDGEVYDPNKEMPGWDKNDFKAQSWLSASYTQAPGGQLMRHPNPNMKIVTTLQPVSIRKTGGHRFLVDLGQNMVGWVSLKANRIVQTPVLLRYAERLKGDDSLYTDNLRSAWVRDSIAPSTQATTIEWHPQFVSHGFRYVEVTGVDDLKKEEIEGQAISDEMMVTGNFKCSEPMLNKIYQAAYWTILGNYKGLPVDCPQRDERMGWLGDRSANSFGESFMFDNYLLYAKWLDDIADAQTENGAIPDVAPSYWHPFLGDNMTWPSTYLFVPDMMYRQFGDKNIIVKHYSNMKRWMAHMKTYFNSDSLIDRDSYGDWCLPPESKEMILTKDSTRKTPKGFIASTYYIHCLKLMEKFAVISGHKDDSVSFEKLRAIMTKAVNNKYYNTAQHYYANNTITSNLLALAFDIVPTNDRQAVAANIVKVSKEKFDNHLGTGLIGNQWLMQGLTDNGYADVAYKIATNTTYPSWGYMIESGATTIWELWNGNTADPAMNSGNHVMLLGDLMSWYYERLAGIKSLEAGFKKIGMRPLIRNDLSFVEAEHISPYGAIKSHWTHKDNTFTWDITIPGNSTALVHIPAASREAVRFTNEQSGQSGQPGQFGQPGQSGQSRPSGQSGQSRQSGQSGQSQQQPAKFIGTEEGHAIFELLPGTYAITSKL